MNWRAFAALSVAVLAISWGAPLARLTDAAPLAVAMWRTLLATLLLAPVAVARRGGSLPPRHRPAALLAGLLLGLHFGLWVPSLWLTSVSASVVLVTTAPLWVLLLSPRFLGVGIRARNLASFALAITGVAIIAWGDLHLSARALLGDAMALTGAVCAAGYMIVGKRLRQEVPLASYLFLVYGGAAATLVAAVVVLGVQPRPATTVAWLPLLGMAVGPMLLGHGLLNWALAHFEAYRVNLTVLLEPIEASFWTWLVIGEVPPLHVLPGAALVLGALALEFLPRRRSTRR